MKNNKKVFVLLLCVLFISVQSFANADVSAELQGVGPLPEDLLGGIMEFLRALFN